MRCHRTSLALHLQHVARVPCVLAALLLATAGGGARADGDRVDYCFNVWAPYMYLEDDQVVGLSARVLTEATRRAGLSAVFHERPWKRCLHLVESGEMDAVVDAAARPEFLQGPASYNVYSNTFWVQDASPLEAFDLEALRGKTVGLVTGYTYPDTLIDGVPYAIDYSVDDDTLLRKLAAGRVDAVVADLAGTRWVAASQGLALRPLLPSHSEDRLYPSFNRQRTALQARVNAAIQELLADGFVNALYRDLLGLDFDEVAGPGR